MSRVTEEQLADLDRLHSECETYGLPIGMDGLLRHIYANRDLALEMTKRATATWRERAEKAESTVREQAAEISRLSGFCDNCALLAGELHHQWERARRAEATIEQVRELHHPDPSSPLQCVACIDEDGDQAMWPCPTIAALDGGA